MLYNKEKIMTTDMIAPNALDCREMVLGPWKMFSNMSELQNEPLKKEGEI